jgi:hypothetical protein
VHAAAGVAAAQVERGAHAEVVVQVGLAGGVGHVEQRVAEGVGHAGLVGADDADAVDHHRGGAEAGDLRVVTVSPLARVSRR